MKWSWCAPADPPAAQGVVATGDAARALLQVIGGIMPSPFRVAAHSDLLVVVGPFDQLPWVLGATYIAPDVDAAGLWLPTTTRPDVSTDLVQAALLRRHGVLPLLLLPSPAQVISLSSLLPMDAAWAERVRARWMSA